MKTNMILIVMIILTCFMTSQAQYYYSDNRQIPLMIDSSKVIVKFADQITLDSAASFINQYERIDGWLFDEPVMEGFDVLSLNDGDGYDEFIDSLASHDIFDIVNPYYLNTHGDRFLIGNTICCKFSAGIPMSVIDSINAIYGISILRESDYIANSFVLEVDESSQYSVLELANLYYELDQTEFSHPNFLGGFYLDGGYIYDYYSWKQWTLNRVFEINPGWEPARAFQIAAPGDDIIVAVLDDGIAAHEDLPQSRILAGYDFACSDFTTEPCNRPRFGYHGMGCVGIIAASNTVDSIEGTDPNSGIYGICPDCKILPIKMASNPMSDSTDIYYECCPDADAGSVADALNFAWYFGADIISCSWHYWSPVDVVNNAAITAYQLGRDGLGCPLFFSTGDFGVPGCSWPSALNEVIAVGAIDNQEEIWDYSNYGKVDVVAPGGGEIAGPQKVWTLDQMNGLGGNIANDAYSCGLSGEDDLDYLCSFGGTSSSQPIAAGIGALLLAKNPDLTADEVYDIVRHSAESDLYVQVTNPPDEKYGYGMVHPYRALLSISRGDVNCDGVINVLDIEYLISYKFQEGDEPIPEKSMGDVNCDGFVSVLDIIDLIEYKYQGGPAPGVCFNYDLLD